MQLCLCASAMRQTYFRRRLSSLQMQTSQSLVEMFQTACKEKFSSINLYKCDMHPADGRRKQLVLYKKCFTTVLRVRAKREERVVCTLPLVSGGFVRPNISTLSAKAVGFASNARSVCVCSAARRLINVKNRRGLL